MFQGGGTSSSNVGIKTMGPKDIGRFIHRKKKLPPDANVEATTCNLYQLKEKVDFRCQKCHKNHIVSDTVAADLSTSTIICTKCFSKMIRPREYIPTRVVPFPSLLSWLNYEPARVQTTVSSNVAERNVEAALPSGHRDATAMLTQGPGGGGPKDINNLPDNPMNIVDGPLTGQIIDDGAPRGGLGGGSSTTAGGGGGVKCHPCIRTFGLCIHGPLCKFLGAPENLCLAHLMNICHDDSKCGDLHQKVFELPAGPKPPPRWKLNGNEEETPEFIEWVAEKKTHSANVAQWQMWNQPTVDSLLDNFFPMPKAAMKKKVAGTLEDIDDDGGGGTVASSAPLTTSNVKDALAFLKLD